MHPDASFPDGSHAGGADLFRPEPASRFFPGQRSYPLAIIATMAPMLGLLGTVIGMIEAFSKVAILGDTGDAALLADSISKALITTDMGLVLAIPALGAYHYLKQKLSIAELAIEENLEAMFAALDAQKK